MRTVQRVGVMTYFGSMDLIGHKYDNVILQRTRSLSFVTPPPVGVEEKYCHERLSACVCLSVNISSELQVRFSPNFCDVTYRFSSGGVAIGSLLPVLWMTSYLRTIIIMFYYAIITAI